MSRGARIVLIVTVVCFSISMLMAAAGAIFIYREGAIDIRVEEKSEDGSTIHLKVPMALVRVALALVPLSEEMRPGPDVRPYWPLVEAACSGISRAPDGVLVEVESPDEHVIIEKKDGYLVVDVDDEDAQVHISIPVRAVEYVVRRIGPSGPGWGPKATITLSRRVTRVPGVPRA